MAEVKLSFAILPYFLPNLCASSSNVPEPLKINFEAQTWEGSFVFFGIARRIRRPYNTLHTHIYIYVCVCVYDANFYHKIPDIPIIFLNPSIELTPVLVDSWWPRTCLIEPFRHRRNGLMGTHLLRPEIWSFAWSSVQVDEDAGWLERTAMGDGDPFWRIDATKMGIVIEQLPSGK